jgi:type IV pilus assembly protein PilQ
MRIICGFVAGILVIATSVLCAWRVDSVAQQPPGAQVVPYQFDEGPEATAPESAEVTTTTPGNVTVDFKNADIQTVLRVLSLKSGVNIVAADNVRGSITIRLVDVPWDIALETILRTYDFAYERVGNVITVGRVKDLTEKKKELQDLFEVQPVTVEVFTLKYLNSADVIKSIQPLLSKRGKGSVLYRRGQKGWGYARLGMTKGEAGTGGERETMAVSPGEEEKDIMSKTLVVIDIPPYVEKIRRTIEVMDTVPKQVFIETRIVEVRRDKLQDLGFDISTGSVSTFSLNPVDHSKAGASMYTGNNTPQPFRPQSDGIKGTADPVTKLFNTGLNLVYKKLGGFEFEVIMHALEEDVNTNVLSAPKIRTAPFLATQ